MDARKDGKCATRPTHGMRKSDRPTETREHPESTHKAHPNGNQTTNPYCMQTARLSSEHFDGGEVDLWRTPSVEMLAQPAGSATAGESERRGRNGGGARYPT